ncbi:hypothetical protein QYF36_004819 [Acer negundo]|nr:hypothetical protein QYF36_004819 [Acer negundo]
MKTRSTKVWDRMPWNLEDDLVKDIETNACRENEEHGADIERVESTLLGCNYWCFVLLFEVFVLFLEPLFCFFFLFFGFPGAA